MIFKLYAGKTVINSFGSLAFQYADQVLAMGGGVAMFASFDNHFLNPGGRPKNFAKTYDAMFLINLPTAANFDTLDLLPAVYNLQTILTRQNPAYSEVTPVIGLSMKQAALAQLRQALNSVFTSPERNQIKQDFPYVTTLTGSIHDTFIPILWSSAYLESFTIPDNYWAVQVASINGPLTVTLPAIPPSTLTIGRIDTSSNAVTIAPNVGQTTSVVSIAGNSEIKIRLNGSNWILA